MTYDVLILLMLGAGAAGFINGLSGFGAALFSLGFMLQIMTPVQAVAVILVLSVITGVQGVWEVRRSIAQHPKRLLIFLIPGLCGIPIGVEVLTVIDASVLRISAGLALLTYGAYFCLQASLPKMDRSLPVVDGLVGFAGGVLGGAASLSGALPTMWCSLKGWVKNDTRAVLQPYNFSVLLGSIVLLASKGVYGDWETIVFLLIASPVSIVFGRLGIITFRQLSDAGFRRLLFVLMLVSGVSLLGSELLELL